LTKDEKKALEALELKLNSLAGDIKRQAEAVTDPMTRRRLMKLVLVAREAQDTVQDLRGKDE
jgi:hypothetical protein